MAKRPTARTGSPGQRIRQARTAAALRQADLARSVGISPSYLNLIEHDRRKIGGKLLLDLAGKLNVDVALLAEGAESQLVAALAEAAGDAPDLVPELSQAEELARRFPKWAALTVDQHRRIAGLTRSVAELSDRLANDPQLSASVHEMLSTVTAIQSTSAILVEPGEISEDWQRRFNLNIFEEAKRLADASHGLVRYLDAQGEAVATPSSPQEEVEAWLAAQDWHVAGLEQGVPPAQILQGADFSSTSAQALAEAWLAAKAARAQDLPLGQIAPLAQSRPDEIADTLGVPMSLVLRRLADLPTDLTGPLGMVEVDVTGAVLHHRPVEGFAVPRFGAGCGLWPVFETMLRPHVPIHRVVKVAGRDGVEHSQAFDVFACADAYATPRFDTPPVMRAVMVIRPTSTSGESILRVGGTCRICPRQHCAARREPSILSDGF